MADANTTQPAESANPAPVTNAAPAENPGPTMGTETESGSGSSANTPADSTEQAASSNWAVFWVVLLVAVFVILWRTGKIDAIKKYLNETRDQLRKATWPTRDELKQHIVVVLLSSVLLAAFTVAADFVVREIIWGALLNGDTVLFDKTQ